MINSLQIGTRIRNLRLVQNRTLQDIANACDLSKSMVSKIETNAVVPSVATLVKIAKSLGTNVSVLMEESTTQSSVMISAEKANNNITQTDRGYHIFPFAAEFKNKKMQPFLFVANKGEVTEHHLTHEGEEFIHVLEGEMKLQVGTLEYLLKQGDSVYFNSLEQHGIMPVSDSVKYINIFV
ncbi:MAG: XRE family transcriptional regulator [Paludibacter sp.]|nr:XRE family transcriptional regulator [Paludibacter sp.]